MPAVPADPDPVADGDGRDVVADRVDGPDDLVPRYARELESGPQPVPDEVVAVADAAGRHLQPNLASPWLRRIALLDTEALSSGVNGCDSHTAASFAAR